MFRNMAIKAVLGLGINWRKLVLAKPVTKSRDLRCVSSILRIKGFIPEHGDKVSNGHLN